MTTMNGELQWSNYTGSMVSCEGAHHSSIESFKLSCVRTLALAHAHRLSYMFYVSYFDF